MKRKIDADSQGAQNQREETRLEIDRHRMPRKQIDAYEQVERSPEEIHDGGGGAFATRIGEGCRKSFAAQSADQMRDTIAEESPGKKRRDIIHAITSEPKGTNERCKATSTERDHLHFQEGPMASERNQHPDWQGKPANSDDGHCCAAKHFPGKDSNRSVASRHGVTFESCRAIAQR